MSRFVAFIAIIFSILIVADANATVSIDGAFKTDAAVFESYKTLLQAILATLLGPVLETVAILAVLSLGLSIASQHIGQLSRRFISVIIGLIILYNIVSIVEGIFGVTMAADGLLF